MRKNTELYGSFSLNKSVFSSWQEINRLLILDVAMHNDTGKDGELLALSWFENNQYKILHHNWRYKYWEIDIIATKNNVLHFIEVKTRTSSAYGFPEEKVDQKKLRFLINAAEQFIYLYPGWPRLQFDILSIIINKAPRPHDYFLIEDVYE